MRSLTPDECSAWARDHGVTLAESGSRLSGKPPTEAFQFKIPGNAGAQIALSEALLEAIPEIGGSLLWITGWPLYKDHEMALVMGVRAGFGESRWLIQAP